MGIFLLHKIFSYKFESENIATEASIKAKENNYTAKSVFKKIKSLPLKALGIYKSVRVVEAEPPVDNEDICQEVQEDEQVDVEAPKREGGLHVTLERRPDNLAVRVSHVVGGDQPKTTPSSESQISKTLSGKMAIKTDLESKLKISKRGKFGRFCSRFGNKRANGVRKLFLNTLLCLIMLLGVIFIASKLFLKTKKHEILDVKNMRIFQCQI